MSLNPQIEFVYADAYIQYMGIVHTRSEPNWQEYLKEALLCYKQLSKETQKLVDEKLSSDK